MCGPKGRHDPERRVTRHGQGAGLVSLGERWITGATAANARRRRLRGAAGANV